MWTLQSNWDCVWVAPASHGSLFALSRCWRHFATATVTTQGPGADTALHRGALSSDWAWELPNCFMENRMFSLSGDNQHKSRESSPRARSNEETPGAQVDSAELAASGEVDDLYILKIVHKILHLFLIHFLPSNSAIVLPSSNFNPVLH